MPPAVSLPNYRRVCFNFAVEIMRVEGTGIGIDTPHFVIPAPYDHTNRL